MLITTKMQEGKLESNILVHYMGKKVREVQNYSISVQIMTEETRM